MSLTNGTFLRAEYWHMCWSRGGANADFVTAGIGRSFTHASDFADLQTETQMMESRMYSRTDRPRSIADAFVYTRIYVRRIAL